jgi:hypothetical protein
MTVEEVNAMSLMPLETPVLKVSRPVAVTIFSQTFFYHAQTTKMFYPGLQSLPECQDKM